MKYLFKLKKNKMKNFWFLLFVMAVAKFGFSQQLIN